MLANAPKKPGFVWTFLLIFFFLCFDIHDRQKKLPILTTNYVRIINIWLELRHNHFLTMFNLLELSNNSISFRSFKVAAAFIPNVFHLI